VNAPDANADRLRVQGLSIGALQDVSLDVAPGEIVCLSGESGSGKTRLLRAIADLEPHEGEAMLGKERRSAVAAHCWRGWVMLVPAESSWWADRVIEHFKEPVPGSLVAFGFGEDTLDWEVARLSSGEKQRLAVLRALSHEPRALLLDEPTANLDPDTTLTVESWLRDHVRAQRIPVIWAAHDRAQIERVADRHFTIRGAALEEESCRQD